MWRLEFHKEGPVDGTTSALGPSGHFFQSTRLPGRRKSGESVQAIWEPLRDPGPPCAARPGRINYANGRPVNSQALEKSDRWNAIRTGEMSGDDAPDFSTRCFLRTATRAFADDRGRVSQRCACVLERRGIVVLSGLARGVLL